jgi:hypothetical protein
MEALSPHGISATREHIAVRVSEFLATLQIDGLIPRMNHFFSIVSLLSRNQELICLQAAFKFWMIRRNRQGAIAAIERWGNPALLSCSTFSFRALRARKLNSSLQIMQIRSGIA